MWLLPVRGTLALIGAVVGIVAARERVGLAPVVAVVVGGVVGSALAGLALGPVADRIEEGLHRMGGPRR